jgi:hypothetical protein
MLGATPRLQGIMDDLLILSLLLSTVLVLVVTAVLSWRRSAARKRHEQLRSQGYKLIRTLNAYSAWVDFQRDNALVEQSMDELTLPGPLARSLVIKDIWFPSLSHHMLRMLQAHAHLMEYLWQHNLLRLSLATGWMPAYQDPQYQQIRGAQEDLIEEMISMCREIIGEGEKRWNPTGTDFTFTNSVSVSSMGPSTGS